MALDSFKPIYLLSNVAQENGPEGSVPDSLSDDEKISAAFRNRLEGSTVLTECEASPFEKRRKATMAAIGKGWTDSTAEHGTNACGAACAGEMSELVSIGITVLVQAELKARRSDTSARKRTLENYFKFEIVGCKIDGCSISIQTNAEFLRTEMAARDSKNGPQNAPDATQSGEVDLVEVGREEALRLFAELACFSSARSYTQWPQADAHQMVMQRKKQSWEFGKLFGNTEGGLAVENSRNSMDLLHSVIGMGDDGASEKEYLPDCGPAFFELLDKYRPDGDFVHNFRDVMNYENDSFPKPWRSMLRCLVHKQQAGVDLFDRKMRKECKHGSERDPVPKVKDPLSLSDIAAVVRALRDRTTTLSWIVLPEERGLWSKGHVGRSLPLSALISVPSWWPGLQIEISTCWIRPKTLAERAGEDLCADKNSKNTGTPYDNRVKRLAKSGIVRSTMDLPLPFSSEDVLQKLGFFIIRVPYLDGLGQGEMNIESGRHARVRLTGARLWKNPMVRMGEQWHDKIEVLPDMKGIVATFKCVAPLAGMDKLPVRFRNVEPLIVRAEKTEALKAKYPKAKYPKATPLPDGVRPEQVYSEPRAIEVWTSEGKTNQVTATVRAFHPNFADGNYMESACWGEQKEASDE